MILNNNQYEFVLDVPENWSDFDEKRERIFEDLTWKFDKDSAEKMLKIYEKLGYDASARYSLETYREMLKSCGVGRLRTKLIDGVIPCCYAVIEKV